MAARQQRLHRSLGSVISCVVSASCSAAATWHWLTLQQPAADYAQLPPKESGHHQPYPAAKSVTLNDIQDIEKRLSGDGFCVVDHALTAKDRASLLSALQVEAYLRPDQLGGKLTPSSYAEGRRHRTRPLFVESTTGRFHRTKFDAETKALLEDFASRFVPIVDRFFDQQGRGQQQQSTQGIDQGPVETSPAEAQHRPKRAVLTQLQHLVSAPNAVDQFFHQDNSAPGLTIVVPLCRLTPQLGPTQLIAGTHRALLRRPHKLQLIAPCPDEHGVLIFDSRTAHRGLRNLSQNDSRPVLIIRYDCPDTPPPGHGVLSTLAVRVGARVLAAILDAQ